MHGDVAVEPVGQVVPVRLLTVFLGKARYHAYACQAPGPFQERHVAAFEAPRACAQRP
jgi:hypothetical protein